MIARDTLSFRYSSASEDHKDRQDVITLDVGPESTADFAWLAAAFGLVSANQVALRAKGSNEEASSDEQPLGPLTPGRPALGGRSNSAPVPSGVLAWPSPTLPIAEQTQLLHDRLVYFASSQLLRVLYYVTNLHGNGTVGDPYLLTDEGDDVYIYYFPSKKEDDPLLSNGPSMLGPDTSEQHRERHRRGLTLSKFPQEPSEEHTVDTLTLLHKKFGLHPTCEFRLKDRTGRYFSLRYLPGGQYHLELTSHVTPIPQGTIEKEGVRTTLTGSTRIFAEASRTKLQVNLRVTASPTARDLQTRVRVRVDTNESVLARSPENETRTIAVTNRSGWDATASAGFKPSSMGEATASLQYSHSQETRETLQAWRTVTREVREVLSKRHFLDWMCFGLVTVPRTGYIWEVEMVKEAGRRQKDAQATHSLTKGFSIELDITDIDENAPSTELQLPIVVDVSLLHSKVARKFRKVVPGCPCLRSHVTASCGFLLAFKWEISPVLRVSAENLCIQSLNQEEPGAPLMPLSLPRSKAPARAEFDEEALKRITTLDLGESNFRVINMCLDVLPKLKNLSFKQCQSLQILVLFKSESVHLPGEGNTSFSRFSPLSRSFDLREHQLRSLDLGGCHAFRVLPESLASLPALEVLNLSQTNIRADTFPDDFKLPRLTELNLSDNPQFVHLPDSLLKLPRVRKLDVSRCSNLKTLTPGSNFPFLPQLAELKLYGCRPILKEEQDAEHRPRNKAPRRVNVLY